MNLPARLLLIPLLMLLGCSERDASPAPSAAAPAAPTVAAQPSPAAATGGTLLVNDIDGKLLWTLRLDGAHVELTGPDGVRLIGDQRGDKRHYRRESDGAAVAEVKSGDGAFKLRSPDSQLWWKVKLASDKIKISDNDENQRPWVLKTGYDDKAKILDPTEVDVGEVRFYPDRVKVKDAQGVGRLSIDSTRRSAAFGVLVMAGIPEEQRGMLALELLSRGR
jgi:hypothetical protein